MQKAPNRTAPEYELTYIKLFFYKYKNVVCNHHGCYLCVAAWFECFLIKQKKILQKGLKNKIGLIRYENYMWFLLFREN